jgi:hypothetical protein
VGDRLKEGLRHKTLCMLKPWMPVLLEVSRRVAGCDSRVAVAEREERGGPGCRCIALVDSRTLLLRSVYDMHRTDLTSGISCYTYDTSRTSALVALLCVSRA